MAFTRPNLTERLSEKTDLFPSQGKDAVEHLIEIIKSSLASGEDVMISGFGKFQVNDKAPTR